MKKGIEKILILIMIVVALAQFIQYIHPFAQLKPLAGVVNEPTRPEFTLTNWLSEKFQDDETDQIDYSFGFRPWFIRIYNQLQYSLYHKTKSKDIIIGKGGYLFEKPYITAYSGENFIGSDNIRTNVKNLRRIYDTLQNHHTQLLILLAPNKAWFFPEKIPGYLKTRQNPSNYAVYREVLKSTGIPVLDANRWFLRGIDTSKYHLIPKTGVHWTQYGADLVADSLMKRIGQLLDKPVCDLKFSGITGGQHPQYTDNDLGELLNLIFPIKEFNYAYHTKSEVNCDQNAIKPKAIFIGDSFVWNVFKDDFNDCFEDLKFWYYFSTEYDINGQTGRSVHNIQSVQEMESADLVVLFTTAAYVENPGFGFIDAFMNDFNTGKMEALILHYSQQIKNDPAWLELVRNKAAEQNIPLDSMIWLDAKYMAEQELKGNN